MFHARSAKDGPSQAFRFPREPQDSGPHVYICAVSSTSDSLKVDDDGYPALTWAIGRRTRTVFSRFTTSCSPAEWRTNRAPNLHRSFMRAEALLTSKVLASF
jgi:hypothetical protein